VLEPDLSPQWLALARKWIYFSRARTKTAVTVVALPLKRG
jgi:hypothetical protein